MINFALLVIASISLFVSVIIIVDHIEIARQNRNSYAKVFKANNINHQSFGEYCNKINLTNKSTIEELSNAHKEWKHIIKNQNR